jgi:hypothetical protein
MTRSIRSIQGEALREIAAELDEQRATLESVLGLVDDLKGLIVKAVDGNTETRGRLLDTADRLGTRVLNVEQGQTSITKRVEALERVAGR